MRSIRERSAGFTILEVLITLAILSLVVMSATKLLTSNVQAVQRMDQSVEYTQNLRIATNQILDKIKKENSVKVEVDNTLLKLDDKPVLDINDSNTSNTSNAELWLYKKGEKNYELRDKANKVIAEYIESIVLKEPSGKPYVNIEISVVDTELATLSIPKTFAFSSVMPHPNDIWKDFVTFSHRLDIQDATILGPGSSIYVANEHDQNFALNNHTTVLKVSNLYVEKHLVVNDSILGLDDGSSKIYIDGNVNVHNQPDIKGMLYYTGSFSRPIPNSEKVDSVNLPPLVMPTPKPNAWYVERGYTNNATPRDNMKYKGGTIYFNMVRQGIENVSIYSTGDIKFQNGSIVKGILYAPQGTVEIWDSTFQGIIIADRITIRNTTSAVIFKLLNPEDMPF